MKKGTLLLAPIPASAGRPVIKPVKAHPSAPPPAITARQLWDQRHHLHDAFVQWLKSKGIDPATLGEKVRKAKAAKFLALMHVRPAAA